MNEAAQNAEHPIGVIDVLDHFAGATPALARLRALRPVLVELEQRAYDVLFPPGPGAAADTGVSAAERAAAALAVAVEHRSAPAVRHYGTLLEAATGDTTTAERITARTPLNGDTATATATARRIAAAVAHARLLTHTPAEGGPDAPRAAGFTDPQIVTLSQTVAFANHQMHLAAGLALLATGDSGTGTDPGAPSTTVSGGPRYTTDVLTWRPAIRPLAPEELGEEHRAALAGKRRADTPYFRTLGHDLDILAVRTAIDLAAFTAEGGLPRAERELAATAVSLYNGCVYCASVHARLTARLHGDPAPVHRFLAHGSTAVLGRRWKLIVRLAAGLAPVPATAAEADVEALRAQGLTELALVDLVHCAAFFGWANRLMLSLGSVAGEAEEDDGRKATG
ncbi:MULTISPECIES: peroxidase-related enzyme [Streptomyces]|uniref:peroxidase-related enzyme n=1 Tax=Streptomyces lycopersici TaxID=2974589 RepID=UPI0021D20DE1|nr:peroxidase-related enzyme [Streptomyces sp. NEAU-383]